MAGRRTHAVWWQALQRKLSDGIGPLWHDRTLRYVTLLILALGIIGNGLPFEPYDWMQKSLTARVNAKPYTGDALIIEIDSRTFAQLGRPGLDDQDLARLIRNLEAARPKRIVLGRIRQRPSSQRSSPELLQALAAARPRVVMFTELVPKKSQAFSWYTLRPDRGDAYFDMPSIDQPTAALVDLASEISSTTPFGAPWGLPPTIRLGARDYPSIAQIIAGNSKPLFGKYEIDLRTDPATIPTLNAADVIQGQFDRSIILGRQTLIYSASDVTRDAALTPFGRTSSAAPISIMAADTLTAGPPLALGWLPAYLVAVLGVAGWLSLKTKPIRRLAFGTAFLWVVFSPLVLEPLLIFQSTSNAVFLMLIVAVGRQWSKFRATLALARSAAETKSWFLAQASHDLRQPIHAIGMLAARLGQTDLNPLQAELARKIDHSIDGANRMLQSLLDLATIESGSLSPQLAPVPVNALLADLDEQTSQLAERAGVELRLVPSEATILADRSLTLAMLQNIVSNSIKYATGRRILVGVRRSGKTLSLCVYDVGQGISDEDMRHVRKAFFRASSHKQGGLDGAGLGLAIVHRLAGLMKLTFTLTSRAGKGTAAIISGYAQTDAAPITTQSPDAKAMRPLIDLRVILVDDDAVTLAATAALLEQWGCRVTACEQFPPSITDTDLIISDFDFGKGRKLSDHLVDVRQASAAGIPIIIVSGHQADVVVEAMGSDHFLILTKPVRPAELRSVLMANRSANRMRH